METYMFFIHTYSFSGYPTSTHRHIPLGGTQQTPTSNCVASLLPNAAAVAAGRSGWTAGPGISGWLGVFDGSTCRALVWLGYCSLATTPWKLIGIDQAIKTQNNQFTYFFLFLFVSFSMAGKYRSAGLVYPQACIYDFKIGLQRGFSRTGFQDCK